MILPGWGKSLSCDHFQGAIRRDAFREKKIEKKRE